MTSNIGSSLIQEGLEHINEKNRKEIMEKLRQDLMELLRKTIRPEFLNRIDELILFSPLSLKLQMNRIKEKLADQGIRLDFTDRAADLIANMGFDPQFGARPLKRVIQHRIINELSKEILKGNIVKDRKVIVDSKKDEIVFVNKTD